MRLAYQAAVDASDSPINFQVKLDNLAVADPEVLYEKNNLSQFITALSG